MDLIESIINSTDMIKLLGGLKLLLEECVDSVDYNTLRNELVKLLDKKNTAHTSGFNNNCDDFYMFDAADSPLFLLNAYLYGAEDCEEIIQSIGEFIDNCSGLGNLEDNNEYTDDSSSKTMEVIETCEMPYQITGEGFIKDSFLLFPKDEQTIEICFIHPIILKCSIDEKLIIQYLNRQNLTFLHSNFVLNIIKWHIWLLMQRKLE